ncbi:hypothetical protein B0A48_17182 [Cryoendolithus antarcticus]|uniref:F-box domain-containing protein n=1 Tax=Cryoendolithus antarcticus TaxID=1507870 RepID=A0A1V8SC27_9PEZI|nr:hypothetical protein B0A48_17182 [Cryoendolithus antarcticus]
MSSAASTVLGLPELLESILLHSDPKTVLLAQRVDRTFRVTIRGSGKLQVKLCLKQTALDSTKFLKKDGAKLAQHGNSISDGIDVDELQYLDDIQDGILGLNTLLLESRQLTWYSEPSLLWALRCLPHHLRKESSALAMSVRSNNQFEEGRTCPTNHRTTVLHVGVLYFNGDLSNLISYAHSNLPNRAPPHHRCSPSASATSAHRNMAAATTLSIPELLESILLLADPKTVLLAQRVNKTFRATIKGSERLQIKLFFKQAAAPAGKQYPKIRYMELYPWG